MANSGAGMSSGAAQASGDECQVFLNFRGSDTRHGFTDFLYHELMDAGVCVFKDDDELRVGEVIGENILNAINSSILYIPIFSQTYASSKWCLKELAIIVDNVSKSKDQKTILPIFLDVEPEDVKLRTPLYRAAFEKHKEDSPEEVEAWRKALAEVDEIKGWNVDKDQSQATIVKLVVEKVLEKLEIKQKSVVKHLVGLDDRVKQLTELLYVDHQDVRFIGIYGKGGIGKTTVAKVIFNKLSSHFGKYCSFIENVRESSLTKEGIVQLQRKLLSDIVGSGSAEQLMDTEQATRRIGDTLSSKKVLVVLDDVDKKEHINKIIGGYSLHSGSRIIITTRNKIVLNAKEHKAEIRCYEMLKMDDALALQLFCQHAFDREFPSNIYHGISSKIVSIIGGIPLAIEVIGSLLNGKDEAFWKETLVRLREVLDKDIMEMLRISYDNLDRYQQQIFLDVACFLFNENKIEAIYMWADCQFYPLRGLKVLIDRCLIKISNNDKIWMHDQLIDLGRRIVRQESPFNPGKRSRLWTVQEALETMRTKKRKDDVQALKIYRSGDSIEITDEEFERLQNLRLLELNWGTYAGDFARCHSNLRWFSWHSPQDFRADNMYLEHLVVCKLDTIDFKDDSKAWDLIKRAQNLKVLSITRCSGITRIPNFSKCSHLERLTLANCFNLERIESFIGDLGSLIELKIEQCQGLRDLPEELGALVKLKHLSFSGCRGLRELPGSLENLTSLTELNLWGTSIAKSPGMPLLRHAQEIPLDTSHLESKLDKGAAEAMTEKVGDDGLVVDGKKRFSDSKPTGVSGGFGQESTVKSGHGSYRSIMVPSNWICRICGCLNFARQTSCLQCNEPRIDDAPPAHMISSQSTKKKGLEADHGRGFSDSLSAIEIELSEDYTCVISHGPDSKTIHSYGDCILKCHPNELSNTVEEIEEDTVLSRAKSSVTPALYSHDHFLSFCYTCKKPFQVGEDIYMYRGDKAFCSVDCRSKEVLSDEPKSSVGCRLKKVLSDEPKSSVGCRLKEVLSDKIEEAVDNYDKSPKSKSGDRLLQSGSFLLLS